MAIILLDSSVIIALLNSNDAHHDTAARVLRSCTDTICIATLTITESLVSTFSTSYERAILVFTKILEFTGVRIELSVGIAFSSAHIRATQKLTLADSIIFATAQSVQAQLWTFDKELAAKYPNSRMLA
ncbi:MAG: PIN domain-containing protein [Actinomycetes bacterium]